VDKRVQSVVRKLSIKIDYKPNGEGFLPLISTFEEFYLLPLRIVMVLLDESKTCICSICQVEIASKTKLFKHLEDVHGMENPNAKPCKCVLLIGWLASSQVDEVTFQNDQNVGHRSFLSAVKDYIVIEILNVT
jgi:hypothetical protein